MNPAIPITSTRPDGVLRVIVFGRISTPVQDPKSIASQHHDCERWLGQNYNGRTEVLRLGEQASGLLADRLSAIEAEEEILAGRCDLVLAGESREIYRNPQSFWGFVHLCVDEGVRLIVFADGIDTAGEDWEVMAGVGCLRTSMEVPQIRRRIRRKATYSFEQGGMVGRVKYSYRRLSKDEADSGVFGPKGLRVTRRPECTAVIREMKDRVVLRGDSLEEIAEWLNDEGITPGDYVKSGRWTAALVGSLLRDPILSGTRRFRLTVSVPVRRTGEIRRRRNDRPELKEVPELAHLTHEEQVEMVAVLDARARSRRTKGKDNPLFNKPRARTLWPGQAATCGICGARMHSNGTFLRCSSSTAAAGRTCWNRVHVELDQIRTKVLPWVLSILGAQPRYRQVIAEAAWEEYVRQRRRRSRAELDRDRRIVALELEVARLTAAIKEGGEIKPLVTALKESDAALEVELAGRRAALVDEQAGGYGSAEEVAGELAVALPRLAETSTEFADVLRRLLPVFVIHPVQALDTGQVRPRVEVGLSFSAWAAGDVPFEAQAAIDLFEPPVHIAQVADCTRLRQADPNLPLKAMARELGVGEMTVRRALDYASLMARERLDKPFRVLTDPPAAASRWGKRAGKEKPSDGRTDGRAA